MIWIIQTFRQVLTTVDPVFWSKILKFKDLFSRMDNGEVFLKKTWTKAIGTWQKKHLKDNYKRILWTLKNKKSQKAPKA